MDTILCAAFCGAGKTYFCNNSDKNCIEFECWKYDEKYFPNNYINDIKSQIGKNDYIFISTNPHVLYELNDAGIKITLIYPKLELKEEYLQRYRDRGSPDDFIEMLNKHWNSWLVDIGCQNYCNQIVLESGEYISDVL